MAQTQNIGIVCVYPRGAWSGTTAYKKLSLVTYNNAAYIATQDNVGIEPSVSPNWSLYWMLLLNNPNPEEITVDAAISSVSENPVQNKAIAAALAQKLSTGGGTVHGDINMNKNNLKNVGGVDFTWADTGGQMVPPSIWVDPDTNLSLTGPLSFKGYLYPSNVLIVDGGAGKITGLIAAPVNDSDAANKEYVDTAIQNFFDAIPRAEVTAF